MIQRIVRPGVEVQQIFLKTNPSLVNPDLPTVIVGLNIQIVDDGRGGNYAQALGALSMAYPELEGAAVVRQSSVEVKMTDVELMVYDGMETKAAIAEDKLTIDPVAPAPDFVATGVEVGDDVICWQGEGADQVLYRAKVASIEDAKSLTLDRDLPFTTPADFVIERSGKDFVLPAAALTVEADKVTIKAGLTVDGKLVAMGKATISYRAVRRSTANRLTVINNATEITAKLGKLSPENPLALGVFAAKANTVSSVLAMAVEDDSPLGWLTALNFLQTQPVYTIVMLSQSATVQGLLKPHVEQMSMPERSRFRVGFINISHPREKVVVEPLPMAAIKRVANVVTVTQPNAEFAGVVLAGDLVRLNARTGTNPTVDATKAGLYKVVELKNNSTIVLESAKYTGEQGTYVKGADLLVDFAADYFDLSVIRVLDKDGQADAIARTADSIASRRITYITNHSVDMEVGDSEVEVPGYYLAAAYGGMNAGNPPHQGFTNLGVVGIKRVRYGGTYFNDDQLSLIAGSGGCIVCQETENALPAMYLQTTTDTSSVNTREQSITKTLDFYSIGLKNITSKFIGPYNLTKRTIAALKNAVGGWHTKLLGMDYERIGTPITSGVVKQLKEDQFEKDTAVLVTDIEIPAPLNRLKATVEVIN